MSDRATLLSQVLFNIVKGEILQKVRQGHGYQILDKENQILCYADDASLIAETEDDLQRPTNIFKITSIIY